MKTIPAAVAGILALVLASPAFAQQPVRRLEVGIATPSLDARVG